MTTPISEIQTLLEKGETALAEYYEYPDSFFKSIMSKLDKNSVSNFTIDERTFLIYLMGNFLLIQSEKRFLANGGEF